MASRPSALAPRTLPDLARRLAAPVQPAQRTSRPAPRRQRVVREIAAADGLVTVELDCGHETMVRRGQLLARGGLVRCEQCAGGGA